MANNKTSDTSHEKTYTYREYKKHFYRSARQEGGREKEEREPSEVGKEMAKEILERLMPHE